MILYALPDTFLSVEDMGITQSKTHLELRVAIFDDHVVPRIDCTLLDAQLVSYGSCDQLGAVRSCKKQPGEDDGEVGIAHILSSD